jgi:hypothetical protein
MICDLLFQQLVVDPLYIFNFLLWCVKQDLVQISDREQGKEKNGNLKQKCGPWSFKVVISTSICNTKTSTNSLLM